MSWKNMLSKVLLPEHSKKIIATINAARDHKHNWSVEKTVWVLTLRKQPFKDEFKHWIKANIKTEQDLTKLRDTLANSLE